jgi:hypothetical protein
VLLLGLAFFCLDRKKPAWAGAAMAGAAFLRPTVAPVLLPFLATRKWPVVLGAVAGMAVCLGASLPVTGIQVYRSSQRAIAGWDEVFSLQYRTADPNDYEIPPALAMYRPEPPRVIEGVATPGFRHDLWRPPAAQSYSLLGVSNVAIFLANRYGATLHPEAPTDVRLRVLRACCLALLVAGFLMVARRGGNYATPLLMLIGVFLVFLAEYMTLSVRHLYGEVFQVLPLGVLGPMLFDRQLPRFYRGCGLLGAFWALLSYLNRLLPVGAQEWVTLMSWIGPYSALVFFGGAVLYLVHREAQRSASSGKEQTCC